MNILLPPDDLTKPTEFSAHNWAEDTNREHRLKALNWKCRLFVWTMMALTVVSYFVFYHIFHL